MGLSHALTVIMIRFVCPTCEKMYKVPDSMGGKPATCTQCRTRFLIPNPPSVLELDPLPPPPPPPLVEPAVLDAEVVEEFVLPPPALPPPPPPLKHLIPVVLEPCPKCRAVLTVSSELVGQSIECPYCKTVYSGVARKPTTPEPIPISPAAPVVPNSRSTVELSGIQPLEFSTSPPAVDFTIPVPPPPVWGTQTVSNPAPPEPEGVEIAPCPRCRAELRVAPGDVGGDVECPFCKTVYRAVPPKPKDGTLLAKVVRRGPPSSQPPPEEDQKKPYRFKWNNEDDDEDDRPRRRRR
jgi:uncharacterized protein YbaR (Trm112 family)